MFKDVKFANNGDKLNFNVGGYAIDPQNGTAWFSADFRDILLTVVGTGNVIVYGTTQKTPPDFTASSTIDNSYAAITLADLSIANTYYNGASGVSVAGATKIVEVNTNLLTWIAIKRDVGTVDVKLTETNAL